MQLEWNLTVGSYPTQQDFIFGVPDCLAFRMINNCQDFANSNGHSSYVLITVHSQHDTNLIGPLRVKKKKMRGLEVVSASKMFRINRASRNPKSQENMPV